MNGHRSHRKQILGWVGVGFNLLLSGFWAVWGSIENFHEGWFSSSLFENLAMFFIQYLLFAIVFVTLGLVSVRFKIPGLILHLAAMAGSAWFFRGSGFFVLGLCILLPMSAQMLLHYFGEPRPRKIAMTLLWVLPLAIVLILSVPRAVQVSGRTDDGDYGIRTVEGNGVTLTWAPRGPGWPDKGVSWEDAKRICRYLSQDGLTLCETEQNYWRLPSVAEAVASMSLHNQNAGGSWDNLTKEAHYTVAPDKETPLWDPHSKVIYYWTSDQAGDQAYIIVYHGGIFSKNKSDRQDYISFRAVRIEPEGND